MKSYREELWFETKTRRAFINITQQVEAALKKSGIQEGLCLVNAMHISASVFINDDEQGLHHDFEVLLEKLAPHEPVILTIPENSIYKQGVGVYTLSNMDFSSLTGFEWDEGNLEKVLQRMEPQIAEMAFKGEPWVALSRHYSAFERRWFLINKVVGRYLFVVFTVRNHKIRVISARYMHRKEARFYEKKFKEKRENDGTGHS